MEAPAANIYSTPPINRATAWAMWKDIFLTTTFETGIYGAGFFSYQRYCKGCHSIDHNSEHYTYSNVWSAFCVGHFVGRNAKAVDLFGSELRGLLLHVRRATVSWPGGSTHGGIVDV